MINKYNHPLFHWHFEVSSKCSLKCPRCPRTEKMGKYKITELDLEFFKTHFPPEFICEHMDRILFCGGQGDPIYCKEFLDIIRYFKESYPDIIIEITTNGSYKTVAWWKELKSILTDTDSITFSIDGWDNNSNNQYRVNSNFESILSGLDAIKGTLAYVRWSTIMFKFNQDRIDDIEELAKEYGADTFDLTQSMLFGSHGFPQYIDPETGTDLLQPDNEYVSRYGRHERYFKDLTNKVRRIPTRYFERKQYYEDLWKEKSKNLKVLPLCMTNNRGKYIDAEGIVYPCSWVSHPFGQRSSKFRQKQIFWKDSLWVAHKDTFNLTKRSLEDVLNDDLWGKLISSWSSEGKCFIECEQKCRYKENYKRKKITE